MRKLTEQKQTRLHTTDVKGNCMMTCYANYLGYDVENCPRIEQLFEAPHPANFWLDVVELWWKANGYDFFRVSTEDQVFEEIQDDYYFVCGTNPKSGTKHMVIYKNKELVFDPLPNGIGVIDPFAYEFVKER